MKRSIIMRTFAAVAACVMTASLVACGGSQSTSSDTGGSSLVVNTNFDAKSFDPGRAYEFTSNMVGHQIYETALTFGDGGNDFTTIEPGIAEYEQSEDAKELTLTVQDGHTFSSGNPVTADDVLFSLQRMQGMEGNPSFLLSDPAGEPIDIEKTGDDTITMTSTVAYPSLPYILAFPATGIVEKKIVEEQGGTITPDDKAETWLNSNSAGSGPYKITSADIKSEVKLSVNDNYSSGDKPKYTNVVIQNTAAATQKINIQAGSAQLALDLGPDDVSGLDESKIKVATSASMYTLFVYFNADKTYGKEAADPNFVQAFRHALNYDEILEFSGEGSVQPGGIIPLSMNGALEKDDNNVYDPTQAKELLAQSGYNGEEVELILPSDTSVSGVNLQNLAQKIQEQVKAVGINLKLNPMTTTTWLDAYRDGTAQGSLAYWGPDYPEAGDYAAFGPDGTVGLRAGWKTGAGIASAEAAKPYVDKAQVTVDKEERITAWQEAQKKMNEGPIIPIVTPSSRLVYSSSLSNVVYNPVWYISIAAVN